MVSTQRFSPAKINLMLRIVGQRTDGYHLLQTCFQLLDWGDNICFTSLRPEGTNQLEIEGFDNIKIKDNLIYKAAQMLKPWAKLKTDWLVQVDKQIPLGAGLGGGSSNAATVLKFLNQMKFDTPYILLLFPGCHANTAELFREPALVRNQSSVKSGNLNQASFWINDFMPIILEQFPPIKIIYRHLQSKIDLRLSGSGSTLFAVFDDLPSIQKAYNAAVEICQARIVKPQLGSF